MSLQVVSTKFCELDDDNTDYGNGIIALNSNGRGVFRARVEFDNLSQLKVKLSGLAYKRLEGLKILSNNQEHDILESVSFEFDSESTGIINFDPKSLEQLKSGDEILFINVYL
eukprot:TRINITY_DN1507_c0_g1_i1.p1 TRINITY_DN1507_c0_g1~~TRINITY_DN1507_c0_g1_i1.p1  ORF type:complete len:113 (+),score=27.42 TRINITY_DN1507_c0_g1_i1:32-370(+)